ncbi:AAA family ATPase [Nocardia sp. NPDC004568]|uniref:AAA family ATPase n=1 Tax=Nocardia sp. NPDC004568 TaxID=3154551 RepID=UPI0033B874A6
MNSVREESGATFVRPAEVITRRIDGDPDIPAAVAALVRASLDPPPGSAESGSGTPSSGLDGVFLSAIRVRGFRGIGPETTLDLPTGPGLTLVTGRNGSGKSSFAEAAELALTGGNRRWDGRSTAWREGWRNLHRSGPVRVELEMRTDGPEPALTVAREWDAEEQLPGGSWTQRRGDGPERVFASGDWALPMELYRPFLSYSELGALVDGKPSELFDALHQLLGLDELIVAHERIRVRRLDLERAARTARRDRQTLLAELAEVTDHRARRAVALLREPAPDLGVLERLVGDTAGGPEPAALRGVLALELPSGERITALADRISTAVAAVAAATVPEVAADLRVLDVLRAAYAHVTAHGQGAPRAHVPASSSDRARPGSGIEDHATAPCPVCGGGTLDRQWLLDTAAAIEGLSVRTADLVRARADLARALAELRVLTGELPPALAAADIAGLDTVALAEAWARWVGLPDAGEPHELPDRLRAEHEHLRAELGFAQQRAGKELDRLDEAWAPFAPRLRAWLDLTRTVTAQAAERQTARAAEEWLKAATARVRDERLAPLAGTARWVWQTLRQQSSVELGGIHLQGNANSARRVQLEVTVDDVDGAALGVMSQGELHALGLALFLPRATVAASPFRFVVIDDPVQAMDPAKVDGLARVLATVAWERQVVVFTHDDRLAEAVRRMQIDARIVEVQRRERSVVEVRLASDPVHRYLDDARALLRTPQLPRTIADELVATCCRSALEAASLARAKRVLLAGGMDHREVQRRIDRAQSTRAMVTLAVLGPGHRIEDLNKHLAKEGRWAVEVVRDATAGAHVPIDRDLAELIADTERFAEWLAR